MNGNRKLRVLIALLMILVLLLSACGHSVDGQTPGQPQTEETAEQEESVPEETAPANVTALWAEDAAFGNCLEFEADSDSETKVVFTTDRTVTDFTLLSVFLEGVAEDGTAEYSCETVYLQETLSPDEPLMVNMTFYGDLPNYGIGYTDTDGTARRFTVSISGEDGSLILAEF